MQASRATCEAETLSPEQEKAATEQRVFQH